MGAIYRDVVRICLRGDLNGQPNDTKIIETESGTGGAQTEALEEQNNDLLSREFLSKVIIELQKCRA